MNEADIIEHAAVSVERDPDPEYQRISKERRRRQNARLSVGRAIASGKLVRTPCEVCGEEKVEGHHDDYSKPLEVRWLCVKHHAQEKRGRVG